MRVVFPGVFGGDGHTTASIKCKEHGGVEVQLNRITIENVISYRVILLDGIPRLELQIALNELDADELMIATE